MDKLPKISSYGNYDGQNYGVHCLKVDLGEIEFYYSYDTLVAYYDHQDGIICIKNKWSTTTGKHLNWIQDDKKKRLDPDLFKEMLNTAIARHIQ